MKAIFKWLTRLALVALVVVGILMFFGVVPIDETGQKFDRVSFESTAAAMIGQLQGTEVAPATPTVQATAVLDSAQEDSQESTPEAPASEATATATPSPTGTATPTDAATPVPEVIVVTATMTATEGCVPDIRQFWVRPTGSASNRFAVNLDWAATDCSYVRLVQHGIRSRWQDDDGFELVISSKTSGSTGALKSESRTGTNAIRWPNNNASMLVYELVATLSNRDETQYSCAYVIVEKLADGVLVHPTVIGCFEPAVDSSLLGLSSTDVPLPERGQVTSWVTLRPSATPSTTPTQTATATVQATSTSLNTPTAQAVTQSSNLSSADQAATEVFNRLTNASPAPTGTSWVTPWAQECLLGTPVVSGITLPDGRVVDVECE